MRSLLLLALSGSLAGCGALRHVVELSRGDLEERLLPKFPIEKRVLVAKLVLERPALLFDEKTERIGFRCDAVVDAVLVRYPGKIGVLGKLSFDRDTKTVYLVEPELIELEMPGLPEEYLPKVKETAAVVLATQFAKIPLHTLEGTERALVQSIDVKEGKVLVELAL